MAMVYKWFPSNFCSFFQWTLIESFTPFMLPFMWMAATGFFIIIIIMSIVRICKIKDWRPFGIQIAFILLLLLIPFNQIV
ncbi:hypothetical protein CWO92_22785 [Heyndrickxia camelliae]|uniref:Uncharacterized protein n=1 Tax=Heyndrickxia camelliae TaxID=1707093 RepID=A0A2N3LDK0_9BACI|nr:hypothetical protein CWO92_22785 [Heyndrickxia camelliae]